MKRNSGKKKVLQTIGFVTAANVVGKCAGFFKDILLTYYYGVNEMTDALFLALSIPTIVLGVFTSAADSAIIPQYTRLAVQGRKRADSFFSCVIGILSVIAIAVTAIMLLFPHQVVLFFTSDFSKEQLEYAKFFLRVFCGFGLLHIWYVFFNAYNTVYGKTAVRAFLLCSSNIIVIISVIINHNSNMTGLVIGMLFANLAHGLFPVFSALYSGYRFTLKDRSVSELKEFTKIFIPIMVSAALFELNVFIDKLLASGMEVGAISALDYGMKIPSIFDSMIVVGIAVVIIPQATKLFIEKSEKLVQYITKTTWYVVLILVPIMFVVAIFNEEIIEIVYMRGAFTAKEVTTVSKVMRSYSPMIVVTALIGLYTKFLHAGKNSKSPLWFTGVGVIVNIVLSVFLREKIGIQGLAVATTIANVISCLLIYIYIRRNIGWGHDDIGVKEKVSFGVAIVAMTCIMCLIKTWEVKKLVMVICGSLCGGAVYLFTILIGWKRFYIKEFF